VTLGDMYDDGDDDGGIDGDGDGDWRSSRGQSCLSLAASAGARLPLFIFRLFSSGERCGCCSDMTEPSVFASSWELVFGSDWGKRGGRDTE